LTTGEVELGIRGVTDTVEIGRGGFAVVYRGFQPAFERLVAVKVLEVLPDESTRLAFQRECRAIGKLSGRSHILTVYEAGTAASGKPYLIMAYLSRGSLEDELKRSGPFSWSDAVAIGTKVARGLEAAHQSGILHRDVKPANILLSDDGEPHLADFGIARIAGATRHGQTALAFTPAYAPPELLSGAPPSPARDVYSLAATLYHLIAGQPPFGDAAHLDIFQMMARVVNEPVPDMRPLQVPETVCQVIERALAKDPVERPLSAESFARELEAAQDQTGIRPHHRPPPETEVVPKPERQTESAPKREEDDSTASGPLPAVEKLPIRHGHQNLGRAKQSRRQASAISNGPGRAIGVFALVVALLGGTIWLNQLRDSGEGGTGSNGPPGAKSDGAVSTAAAVGKPGGVFRLPIGEPAAIDPYQARESEGSNVSRRLFTGLVTFDGNRELNVRPGVAERWSPNDDCTEWTFNLRSGAKFHNGEEVDAAAFIRGWTRAATGTAGSQVVYHLEQIQGYAPVHAVPPTATTLSGVSAPDPYTLLVKLVASDCEFDKQLVHPVASPVPSVAGAANNAAFNDAPIGNGPFMIKPGTKWEHNQRISLVRNENYFLTKPFLDGIEFIILPAQGRLEAEYRAFTAGEVDFARIAPALIQQAEATYKPQGSFIKTEQTGIHYIIPNNARAPFNNPDARKALSMAIDREAINKSVEQGYLTQATSLTSPAFGAYFHAGVCGDWCKYDVAKAKDYAARGGLTPGTRIKLAYNNDGGHEPLVQAWKDQLEKNLGLVVELDGVPFAEHLQKRDRGDFDISRAAWSTDYPSTDGYLTPLLQSTSQDNDGKYNNPEVDRLLKLSKAQKNDADRERTIEEIERIAIGRDLALAPTFYRTAYRVFDSNKWTGVGLDFFERPTLETASLK
jgi:oligopeptide transport system substrate-binding protein